MKLRMPDKDVRGIDLTSVDYLSLRDKIAIEAMKSLIKRKDCYNSAEQLAKVSFKISDEMIKQGNK